MLSCAPTVQKDDTSVNSKQETIGKSDVPAVQEKVVLSRQTGEMIDPRDSSVYTTITIGNQTWMAENLRYDLPGFMLNPENPAKAYGRLYKVTAAQKACPEGWHLPSDEKWDELEIAHGMPTLFIGKGGWHGEHASRMRSTTSWEANGTDSLGFNVAPAGYYFSGEIGGEVGMQGLGYCAAYWSALIGNVAMARFPFDARQIVNKWEDKNDDTGAALSCRCVKNGLRYVPDAR